MYAYLGLRFVYHVQGARAAGPIVLLFYTTYLAYVVITTGKYIKKHYDTNVQVNLVVHVLALREGCFIGIPYPLQWCLWGVL